MGLFAEEKSDREITGISHSFSFLQQKIVLCILRAYTHEANALLCLLAVL
jgi:hypothetical protein